MAAYPASRSGWGSAFRAGLLILLLGALALLLPGDVGSPAPRAAPSPEPSVAVEARARLLPTSDLIYRVPVRLRRSCVTLDEPGQAYETLECTEDLSRVQYRRYAKVEDMDRQFDQVTYGLPTLPGGCKAGTSSVDIWRYSRSPDKTEGRMACFFLPENVPASVVTQPEQRVLSIVISNPSLGMIEHYDRWVRLVPNLPTDRQPNAEQSGTGG